MSGGAVLKGKMSEGTSPEYIPFWKIDNTAWPNAVANSPALRPTTAADTPPRPYIYEEGVPARVYCDGGVVGRNGKAKGGVWAWRWVAEDGTVLREESGVIKPGQFKPFEFCGNNLSELVALLRALWDLPVGWRGTIYTDSEVTIDRMTKSMAGGWQAKLLKTVPKRYVDIAAYLRAKLGPLSFIHLAGHPSPEELAAGFKNGVPVSEHQDWCDRACNEAKKQFDPFVSIPAGKAKEVGL